MQSRRDVLVSIAAATVSAAIQPLLAQTSAQDMHAAPMDAVAAHPQEPTFFTRSDYRTVSKIADLIIPRTDTPGAVDVGVPYRVDRQVGGAPLLQDVFKQGLTALSEGARKTSNAEFADLDEAQQTALLQGMSDSEFFKAIKGLTIDWYYNSQAGLVQELGFKGNTFRTSFTGCTHPEHWPAQEGH